VYSILSGCSLEVIVEGEVKVEVFGDDELDKCLDTCESRVRDEIVGGVAKWPVLEGR